MSDTMRLLSASQLFKNAIRRDGNREERLAKIMERFASMPEGKELLDLAQRINFPIRIEQGEGSFGENCEQVSYKLNNDGTLKGVEVQRELNLSPLLSDQGMLEIMAHELRHIWQSHVLGTLNDIAPHFSSLEDAMVFKRLIEGDAHAFQKYFMEKLGGQEPSADSLRETFFEFQSGPRASKIYDTQSIGDYEEDTALMNREDAIRRYISERTKANLSEVGDFSRIFVAGLHEGAPAYLDASDIGSLKSVISKNIGKKARKALSTLQAHNITHA